VLRVVLYLPTFASIPRVQTEVSYVYFTSIHPVLIHFQGDVLRNPHAKNIVPYTDQTKSYKPDLGYLTDGTATSLAGRLAHKLETPPKAPEHKSPPSDNPSVSGTVKRPVDPTIAQRRAARLLREEAARLQSSRPSNAQLREQSTDPQRRSERSRKQFDGIEKLGSIQDGRDAIRPSFGRGERYRRGSAASSDNSSAGWNAGRGSTRRTSGVAARGGAFQKGTVPSRTHTVRTGDEMRNNDDISLEILEEGGDEKEPAEFKGPDTTSTDLDDIFGTRSHTILLDESVIDRTRRVQEASGGDYSRFTPSSNFLVSRRKMSPVKHAQFVLSKRSDVPIIARHRALGIIQSSMSEAAAISVQRV